MVLIGRVGFGMVCIGRTGFDLFGLVLVCFLGWIGWYFLMLGSVIQGVWIWFLFWR